MEVSLIAELAKQGVLAVLLGIALYFYYLKDRALAEAYQKRVDDNNKLATVIEATNSASRALEVTSENRSRVIESMGEATRATAEAIKSQVNILDQVRLINERNTVALAAVQEDMEAMRKERHEDFEALRRELTGNGRARR